MHILLRSIPHQTQRYDTCGDWIPGRRNDPGDEIRVSEMGNEDYHFLVALHELVEFWLCRKHRIREATVTRWDRGFPGPEPGDDPEAPYHREHTVATAMERLMAEALGVDWRAYTRALDRLPAWRGQG